MHAQLTFRGGMVMLASQKAHENIEAFLHPPSHDKAPVTHLVQVLLTDDEIDMHYAKAKAAGAIITMPLTEQEYGGKNYVCREPQGQVWSFGSYDPWSDDSSQA